MLSLIKAFVIFLIPNDLPGDMPVTRILSSHFPSQSILWILQLSKEGRFNFVNILKIKEHVLRIEWCKVYAINIKRIRYFKPYTCVYINISMLYGRAVSSFKKSPLRHYVMVYIFTSYIFYLHICICLSTNLICAEQRYSSSALLTVSYSSTIHI